ncbi:MAG: hypothetical protein ACKPCI_17875 [Dolichospermum sp.]
MTQTLLKETKLLSSIRDRQKQIENFAFSSIIPKFFDPSIVKLIKKMTPKIPMIPYFLYSYFSSKTHYLTKSFDDTNIRQVAIKFRKN